LKVAEAESMPSPSERLLAHSVDGPVEVTIGRIVGISATHSGLPRALAPMVEVDYTARPTWLAGTQYPEPPTPPVSSALVFFFYSAKGTVVPSSPLKHPHT